MFPDRHLEDFWSGDTPPVLTTTQRSHQNKSIAHLHCQQRQF